MCYRAIKVANITCGTVLLEFFRKKEMVETRSSPWMESIYSVHIVRISPRS